MSSVLTISLWYNTVETESAQNHFADIITLNEKVPRSYIFVYNDSELNLVETRKPMTQFTDSQLPRVNKIDEGVYITAIKRHS